MILGLGGVVLDRSMIINDIPEWDTVLQAHHYSTNQGGMVATALAASARLGVRSEFIGAIGDDDAGGIIVRKFIDNRVSCARLKVIEGEPSPCSICLVNSKSGERTIIHYKGLQELESLDIDIDLQGIKYLHLDGYWPITALKTARKAKELGIIVTLDPSSVLLESKYYQEILQLIDYIIPGYAFGSVQAGKSDPREICEALYKPTMQAVVVTQGDRGSYAYSASEFIHVPAFEINALDTTGAGDTFHGAFMVAHSRGYSLKESCIFGNAAAALKCLKMGTQAGIPNQKQLLEFLQARGHNFFTRFDHA